MTERSYFECDGCGMQLHLLAPVDRPCPACGGNFHEIDEPEDEYENSPLDLGYNPPKRARGEGPARYITDLNDPLIDRIVRDQLPGIIQGLEELLAERSPDNNKG